MYLTSSPFLVKKTFTRRRMPLASFWSNLIPHPIRSPDKHLEPNGRPRPQPLYNLGMKMYKNHVLYINFTNTNSIK